MRVNPQAGSIGAGALEQLPPVGEFRNLPGKIEVRYGKDTFATLGHALGEVTP